jgi:hypothetical protein
MAVSGRVLTLGGGVGEVYEIDISDPQNPQVVGVVRVMGSGASPTQLGGFLYVGDGYAGWRLFVARDPRKPKIVGGVDTPGSAGRAFVYGDNLFVADGSSLQVFPRPCEVPSGVGSPLAGRVLSLTAVPNPSSHGATFALELPYPQQVRVSLYDVAGRQVRTLRDGILGAGTHDLFWNGKDDGGRMAGAGIYWARVKTEEGARTARVVIVR